VVVVVDIKLHQKKMVSSSKQTRSSKRDAVQSKRRRLALDFPSLNIRTLPFISLFFSSYPSTHTQMSRYAPKLDPPTLRSSAPSRADTALYCTACIVLTAQGGCSGCAIAMGRPERVCLSQARTVHASQHLGIGSTTTTMQNSGLRYALNAAVCAVANLVCVCDKENKAGKADRPGGLARGDTGERRLSFLVGKIFHGFFDT
jgi:hypothetical protein